MLISSDLDVRLGKLTSRLLFILMLTSSLAGQGNIYIKKDLKPQIWLNLHHDLLPVEQTSAGLCTLNPSTIWIEELL